MITGHVYIATSLDGYVAGTDHRLDWLMKQPTEGEEQGYDEFMESVDGLVMGRGSYETVLGFGEWPYKKPVFVMSKTVSQSDVPTALQDSVHITDLDPAELMQSLGEKGWSRAYIDGGRVVQSFVRASLIDDFIITTVPVLIGDGVRLFGEIKNDIDLDFVSLKSFPSGLVQAKYRVKRDDETKS